MQSDTRKLLTTGFSILLVGATAALLMLTVFGGVTREGPHTNSGWLALVIALGCVPTAAFTLFLGLAKLIGDTRHRS
jgi:drug/metabolite transporter (DMT)-like permease